MADRQIIAAILTAGRIVAEGKTMTGDRAVEMWEQTLKALAKTGNAPKESDS